MHAIRRATAALLLGLAASLAQAQALIGRLLSEAR